MEGVADDMVDTERAANVQTLRALFSQQPVMGAPAPHKVPSSPSNSSKASTLQSVTISDCDADMTRSPSSEISENCQNVSSPIISSDKPLIKPKPVIGHKTLIANGQSAVRIMVAAMDREKCCSKSSSSSSICDNIGGSSENLQKDQTSDKQSLSSNESITILEAINVTLVKKEIVDLNYDNEDKTCNHVETISATSGVSLNSSTDGDGQNSSVESEKVLLHRKNLPSVDKLGPAPLKPSLPSDVEEKYRTLRMPKGPQPPPLPRRNTVEDLMPPERPTSIISRPTRPPPLLPMTRTPPSRPPPAPPAVAALSPSSIEVEELYGDTADVHQLERSNSLIPEYSEDEELGKKDSEKPIEIPPPPNYPPPARPKLPPPPPPSLDRKTSSASIVHDDVNNGSVDVADLEVYEAVPGNEQGPIYSNTKEQKEQQKQMKKEEKERKKREQETEKEKKKFGLTGEEVPIYMGCVKNDNRGGRNDLSVHKGEIVLILRIEKNPSGKWLAKNEKGKRGYVELTNIEVDADSVKSVVAASSSCESGDMSRKWLSKLTSCVCQAWDRKGH